MLWVQVWFKESLYRINIFLTGGRDGENFYHVDVLLHEFLHCNDLQCAYISKWNHHWTWERLNKLDLTQQLSTFSRWEMQFLDLSIAYVQS